MLKKFISVLVAAAMFMAVSVTAFAASVTVKSGDGSVTLHEVTSTAIETFRINKKNVTATIYYCPSGSKITIVPDSSDTARPGSRQAYQTIDEQGMFYQTSGGKDGTDFTVNYSRYGFETYYANKTGEIVYVVPDNFAPSTATPVKPNTKPSESVAPEEKPVLGSDIIHTVKMGDTFEMLALNYFGDTTCWTAIYNYNADAINATKDKQIFVGMELAIPAAVKYGEKIIAAIAPCVAGAGEKLYTVQSGDTLETIALAQYKDVSKSKAIFERNADRLTANTLVAGQIIVLPA